MARALAAEQHARTQLEDASRLQDEFLASVSHELRTPLTAMLGFAQLLATRAHDAAYVARTAARLADAAKTQAQLIEDLLDVSRSRSGTLRVTLAPLDLVPVVEAAIDTVRPASDAKGVQLRVALSRADTTVLGDAATAAAGGVERRIQCGQVHAAGRADRRRGAGDGAAGAGAGAGYGPGHQRGVLAACLRALPAARGAQHAHDGRAGAGAGDRARAGGGARRDGGGPQRGPGPGHQRVHRGAAGGASRAAAPAGAWTGRGSQGRRSAQASWLACGCWWWTITWRCWRWWTRR